MAVRLTITDRRNQGESFSRTFIENRILVGRSRTCHVCLPDLSVSSMHLEIGLQGNEYAAKDLGSLNSTWVGARKLVAHRPKRLANQDMIRVAHYDIEFNLGVAPKGMPDRNLSQEHARRMLGAILSNKEISLCPALIVMRGPGRASRYELPPGPSTCLIGRGRQADIDLADKEVSRRHAEVVFGEGEVRVFNLDARKGMLVNGERVEEATLGQGDELVIGETTLGLEHPLDPTLMAIQRAPEEETSSFSPVPAPSSANRAPEGSPAEEAGHDEGQEGYELPTGPADPLLPKETADYVKTQELPIVTEESGGDLGLIVVGAILVLACVFGLVWLLT